ncbi:MAG: S-layer homology domain-containing protein [Clostridia bacterium]|nr:S-layer homology domain-containing protein [Clostridia bacterium]
MKKLISLILAALMLCGALVTAAFAEESPFADVKTTRWSYGAIRYAYDKGYMDGVGGGKFDPSGTMTRGMVVTVLWRAADKPDVEFEDAFTDVKAGKYYSKAVIWAKNSGIVNGVTESTFEPNGEITREQLATIIYRSVEAGFKDVSGRADLSVFPDNGKTHSYAKDALSWAVFEGIITGVKAGSENLLDPRGKATREQFATIMMRVDEKEFDYVTVYNEPELFGSFTEPEYPLVDDADVYVAVDGSDDNPGTLSAPVRTFNKAAELAREKKAEKTGDIVVAFKAGDYGPLNVTLTAEDTGTAEQRIIYRRYGDGEVSFNNGIDIPLDDFTDLTDEEKTMFASKYVDKIKRADISDKLLSYDPRTTLVMNGEGSCILARFPNMYSDGTDQLTEGAHETLDGSHILVDHPLFVRKFATYHTMDGLLLYGYLTTGWYKDLLTTGEYTVDSNGYYTFTIPYPGQARMGYLRYIALDGFDSRAWSKIAVVNISEELDSANEYWIDSETGIMYVYEPKSDYHITGGTTMLTLDNVEYVSFVGLNFLNCDGNMIWSHSHPRGLTLDGCRFSGCSADKMVELDGGKVGTPYDITVRNCEFSVAAGTGISIRGINTGDLFGTSTGVVVDNNYFTLTNLVRGNMGALKVEVSTPVVTHNYFKKCYWEGVDFRGSVNMLAEYNVFDQVCYNGDDTGVLNNWNSVDRCGNVVRHNLFLNIVGGTNGRYCLYLDDTAGTQVYSNIFFNVWNTVMNNGISKYNTFCDNVIINPNEQSGTGCKYSLGGTELVDAAAASGDFSTVTSSEYYVRWVNAFAYFDSHPEIKAQAAEMWPGYFDITLDLDRWQDDEFGLNASLVITGNREINKTGAEREYEDMIAKHSVIENNLYYSTDENPLFVNPAVGDYRIRDDVTDFPDIEFEKIGRY